MYRSLLFSGLVGGLILGLGTFLALNDIAGWSLALVGLGILALTAVSLRSERLRLQPAKARRNKPLGFLAKRPDQAGL